MEGQIYEQPPPYSEVVNILPTHPPNTVNISGSSVYPTNIPHPDGYQQNNQFQQQQSNKPSAPAPPPLGYAQNYGSIGSGPQVMPTEIIIIGGCPACRTGILEDDYPCLGLACAVLFFPLGILCCLAMKQKRCTSCGAEFSV